MDIGYLKKVGLWIIGALVSVGIILYFGYHLKSAFEKEVEIEAVTEIKTVKTVSVDGVIFRKEVPIFTETSGGSVIPTAGDGERVSVGGAVASVFSSVSLETSAKIAEIESQIKLLNDCRINGSANTKNTFEAEQNIKNTVADIRKYTGAGDAGRAISERNKLLTEINKRNILMGAEGNFDSEIESLESEKAALMSSLGGCIETVCSGISGYYYSSCDGYETVFQPSLLEKSSYENIAKLLEASPAEAGTGGKTVTESYWYYVCILDGAYYTTWTEGDICSVNFKSCGIDMDMEVYRIYKGEDKVALVLCSNDIPSDFDFFRNQECEIETDRVEGIKIPLSAVRKIDGQDGVFVLDGVEVSFRRIRILEKGESFCTVAIPTADEINEAAENAKQYKPGEKRVLVASEAPWLRVNDSLIVEGKDMYEGRIVGK